MTTRDIDSSTDRRLLDVELRRLLEFGRDSVHPSGGAGPLDGRGRLRADRPVELWITSRMVHTYSIGVLLGFDDAGRIAEGALRGLRGSLLDREFGGWYASVDGDGRPVDDVKA